MASGGVLLLEITVRPTDQTLSCADRARVPNPTRRTACLHVSRAVQAARRRVDSDFTRRFSAGPKPGRVSFCGESGARKNWFVSSSSPRVLRRALLNRILEWHSQNAVVCG